LIGAAEQGIAPASSTILYFRVPDIQGAAAALRDKGVVFLQEPHLVARMKSHDLWLAFFKDPAGNPLALMSEVARTADAG
jgi:predicted enzyme related to lactoylglutathione lyase